MKKIKVCHITTVHKDGDVRIFYKICKSLSRTNRYDVSCIVPNTIERFEEGIQVLSFQSNGENRKERIQKAGKIALSLAIKVKADIYHLHDPELLRIAIALKRKTKAAVIFDSHEDVPKQLMDKIWIPAYQRQFISWLYSVYEKFVCKRIDGVISVTPIICNRFKIFQKNVELVANFPDLKELGEYEKNESFSRTICYIGGIFKTRGIIELVKSIEHIDVELILAGTFETPDLEKNVRALPGWKRVNYLGQIDRTEIYKVLQKSEIGVVTLHPTSSYREAYPIKMFEYMAMKNAVLASDFPMWREIVDKSECGECVDPLNVEQISAKLEDMLNSPEKTRIQGENGAKAIKEVYQWEREFEKLERFYHKVIGK